MRAARSAPSKRSTSSALMSTPNPSAGPCLCSTVPLIWSWRFSLQASGSNFRARNFNMSFLGRESRCTPRSRPFLSKMGRSSTVSAAFAISASTSPSAASFASAQRCAHSGFARRASSRVRRRDGRPAPSVAPPAIARIAADFEPVRAYTSHARLNSRSVRAPRRNGLEVVSLMGSYAFQIPNRSRRPKVPGGVRFQGSA